MRKIRGRRGILEVDAVNAVFSQTLPSIHTWFSPNLDFCTSPHSLLGTSRYCCSSKIHRHVCLQIRLFWQR